MILPAASLIVTPGSEEAFRTWPFLTAFIHTWRQDWPQINVLEFEAALLAVQHMSTLHLTRQHRVMIFLDSRAALGALSKGRSSSTALNFICRRSAAVFMEKKHGADAALGSYCAQSFCRSVSQSYTPETSSKYVPLSVWLFILTTSTLFMSRKRQC